MKQRGKAVIVGHRGAKGLALENTAMSMEAALRYGVDQVEVDLRVSKDGVVVLLHDGRAIARDGQRIQVGEHTYRELLGYFPDLLTLEDLLLLVNRRCVIMLEYKERAAIQLSLMILKRFMAQGWTAADFMFASFDYETLKRLHRAMPDVPVVVLESWSSLRAARRANHLGTPYLSMDQRFLWWGMIWLVSRKYKLFCYPHHKLIHIKHAKPNRWTKYGLHGVITDYPNFFLTKQPRGIVETDESDVSPQRRPDPQHTNVLV